jgi:hypothetical protein
MLTIDTTSGTVAAGSFDFENSNFNDTNSRTDRDVTNYGSVIGDLA